VYFLILSTNIILLNHAGFVSLRGAVITPIITIVLVIYCAWASFRKKEGRLLEDWYFLPSPYLSCCAPLTW
jgi:hypothetical protein